MIRDDAAKLAADLQERFGGPDAAVTAESAPSDTRVEFAAPGGARPHIIRYFIRIAGAGNEAFLPLDDAEALLAELAPGLTAEAILAAVAARGYPLEPIVLAAGEAQGEEARDYSQGWF